MNEVRNENFESLLEFLKNNRGFDFTGYKRTTLERRVTSRMRAVGINEYSRYQDYLEVHPDEFIQLFNTILINVTAFFRDPETWQSLAENQIPLILKHKEGQAGIRVWSAGCASGEEAFTIAMLLAEALGPAEFMRRVKIYATDIDEEALARARLGTFSAHELEPVPKNLVEKYFEPVAGNQGLRLELRRSVIFGRHDLLTNAPISRLDLLICRNTLMYMNTETQQGVLQRFHFALNDDGFLMMGKAEMLMTSAGLFTPVDFKHRIFTRVRIQAQRTTVPPPAAEAQAPVDASERLAFASTPTAQIVVGQDGKLVLANDAAQALLGVGQRDVGRPLQDLEVSYRPAEIRSLIGQVYAEHRSLAMTSIEHRLPDGSVKWLDIQARPLHDERGSPLGVSVTFTDITALRRLQGELIEAQHEKETTSEELQATNEELETTNEELQSTVEELQTTNEEVQATNEELETMNEELQVSNEEMQTVNSELHETMTQADEAKAFLESVVNSIDSALVVLDRELKVRVWNRQADKLWGVRSEEAVGAAFLNLDIGLPVKKLEGPLAACLKGDDESATVELDAMNRRGRSFRCRVTCVARVGPGGKREGAIVTFEEAGKQ